MKVENLKVLFNNILFVIGVILLIIGFGTGTNVVLKSVMFDQYPLQVWDEGRCDDPYMYGPVAFDRASSEESNAQSEEQKAKQWREDCMASLGRQRTTKQVEDIATASTLLISGAILTIVFRRYLI